jgi:uncharacterized protein
MESSQLREELDKHLFALPKHGYKQYEFMLADDAHCKLKQLGDGASGVVYLVYQRLHTAQVMRAIKFFILRPDHLLRISEACVSENMDITNTSAAADSFVNEIENLSHFNHEHIIKVIDAGVFSDLSGHKIPFIVTDYVQGNSLKVRVSDGSFLKIIEEDHSQVLELILQLCRGVRYLHTNSFYHCDIAPKNIFIDDTHDSLRVVLGDLGTGKTLRNNSNYVFRLDGTPDYMTPEAISLKDKQVSADIFRSLQPQWDIYGVLKTAEVILNVCKHTAIDKHVWVKALRDGIRDGIENKRFKEISEFEIFLEWVNPIKRNLFAMPELDMLDEDSKRLPLPLESVPVTGRVRKLLEHPSLHRLRQQSSLALGDMVFPGATHTRFEHTLGTYQAMRLYLLALQKEVYFLSVFSAELVQLALVASLISNLPCYPFYQVVEEIRESNNLFLPALKKDNFLSEMLRKDNWTGVCSLGEKIKELFPQVSLSDLKIVVAGQPDNSAQSSIKLIHFLLHSSIDVKIVDYYRRDSLHVGLVHGETFDLDDFVSYLTFSKEGKVVFRYAGLSVLEQLLSLRLWLYQRVYWQTENRALTAMLTRVLFHLEMKIKGFADIFSIEVMKGGQTDVLQFLARTVKESKEVVDARVLRLVQKLTSGQSEQMREIFQICRATATENNKYRVWLDKLSKVSLKERVDIEKELSHRLTVITKIEGFDPILDFPSVDSRTKLEDMLVLKPDGKTQPAKTLSSVISGVESGFSEHLQKLRVFVDAAKWDDDKMTLSLQKKVLQELDIFLEDYLTQKPS